MLKTWRKQLDARLGQQVFDMAMRDMATGAMARRTSALWAAQTLAVVILMLPFLVAGLGAWLISFDYPNLMTILMGVILIAFAFFIRPRLTPLPARNLSRASLPALYALTDRVADALGCAKLRHVELSAEFNAAVYQGGWRREPVMRLGLILWQALNNEEKIAMIAHEMAHLSNNDPDRSRLIGMAGQTLEAIQYYLTPQSYEDEHGNVYYGDSAGLLGMLVNGLLAGLLYLVEGLNTLLIRLSFFENQRAEYFADALGAGVAGTDAFVSALRKLVLGDLIEAETRRYARIGKADGTKLVNRLADVVRNPDPETSADLISRATEEDMSVDSSHPATRYRIAFLEAVGRAKPVLSADEVDFAAIDAELAPHIDRLGLDLDAVLEPE